MSATGTDIITDLTNSGLCVITAPTNKPPLLPPDIANLADSVYLFFIKYSDAAMKSSNTFCFCFFVPARYHSVPNSPPPRRFAMTYIPPLLIKGIRVAEKLGEKERAVDAFSYVAAAWRNTEAAPLKDAVREASAALARLDGDGRMRATLTAPRP